MSEDGDDDVGYAKPPKKHRFKPGQSGNPKGRPPKAARSHTCHQVEADMMKLFDRTIKGPDGAMITAAQALIWKRFEKALKGHSPSLNHLINILFKMAERFEAKNPNLVEELDHLERMQRENPSTVNNPSYKEYIDYLKGRLRRE